MSEPLKFQEAWGAAEGKKVLAGQSGILYDQRGLIKVREGAIQRGVDGNLWRTLKCAVDELKIQVLVYSGDSGKHSNQSRHYTGRAVDLSRIGRPGQVWDPVTVKHPLAILLSEWLLHHGFGPGERRGKLSIPGLIFGATGSRLNPGAPDHLDHIHLSVVMRKK